MFSQKQIEQARQFIQSHKDLLGNEISQILTKALNLCESEQPSNLPAQRKQITIMYADILGLNALGETIDTEDVIRIMNHLWNQFDKHIEHHGGRVHKHMGDTVMALWGIEQSREDDAERAVRAGLAIKQVIHRFVSKHTAYPISIQISIHSGPAILGHVGTSKDVSAIGETVNTAAYLQNATSVNQILISQDTYQLVRGIFNCDEKSLLSIEGKDEPIRTYMVSHAHKHSFRLATRGIMGLETKTIGREKELTMARSACSRAITEHQSLLLSFTGEAGVGKSRILDELEAWLSNQSKKIHYFKGRATQQMQYQPYALLCDIFLSHWNIPHQHYPIEVLIDQIEKKNYSELHQSDL